MNDPHARILVVEDEPMVAEVAERYLRRDGHLVQVVHDGGTALREMESFRPDLLVLDLMLPVVDGWEVCRQVRAQSRVPIIMLTARGEEIDKLLGLELGADDYVTKPFSPRELAARVKAVLRRSGETGQSDRDCLRFADLTIDNRARSVEVWSGPTNLTAREFDLLSYLAGNPGQAFSREQLLDAVWDFEYPGEPSTVTVHMRRLRTKVERDPSRPLHLKTVWGVGYKFDP